MVHGNKTNNELVHDKEVASFTTNQVFTLPFPRLLTLEIFSGMQIVLGDFCSMRPFT